MTTRRVWLVARYIPLVAVVAGLLSMRWMMAGAITLQVVATVVLLRRGWRPNWRRR